MSTARRTQAERSAATRGLLIEAALDSLVERGWAATTSVEVCARAGVTRGAFVHHFDSLPALLAAALQAVYDGLADEAVGGAEVPTTMVGLLDRMWGYLSTARFKAVLEAWQAMANAPELADEIGPVVVEFAALVDAERLAPGLLDDDERRACYLTAREAMLGLALGRATNGGRPLAHESVVLGQLRAAAVRLDLSSG